MTVENGDKCKDVITGFAGVVVGVVDYLTGCKQVLLVPPIGDDGKKRDGQWFDIDRCKVTKKAAVRIGTAATATTIGRSSNGPDIAPPLA